jgi:hypothetical protein
VNRLGAGEADEHVQVRTIALPDLTVPQLLTREQNFSLFIPLHRKAAGRLIEILMGKSISTDTHLLKMSIVLVAVFWGFDTILTFQRNIPPPSAVLKCAG